MKPYRDSVGFFSLLSLIILFVMAVVPSPVYAGAGWDITLTRLTSIPVDSGTAATYELQVQCSAVATPSCNNGQVTLDIPYDSLDLLALEVQMPNPLIQSLTPTATGVTIELLSTFPAGATGTIYFTITSPNGITPDGYAWTVNAAVSADNTGSASANSDGSSTATPNVAVQKWGPGGYADGQVLLVDAPVTYSLVPCTTGGNAGDLWLENGVITDTLPAEAVFQSATGDGVYDAASHTVVWTIPGVIVPSNCGALDTTYQVTVIYPSANLPSLPYFATNTVDLTGTPIGASDPLTVSDDFVHSVDSATPSGTFAKTVTVRTNGTYGDYSVPAYAGDFGDRAEISWYMRIRNTGNVAVGFEIVDNIPCLDNNVATLPDIAYQSVTDGTLCAHPAFVTEAVHNYTSFIQPAYDAGWRAEYVTNAGTTGIFEIGPSQRPGYSYFYPSDVPAGEIIARVIIPYHPLYQIAPNRYGYMFIDGHVVEDDPVGLMPVGARVNNVADITYYVGDTPVVSGSNGSGVLIVAPEVKGNISKSPEVSTLPESGQASWYIQARNNSSEAVPVVITDLLPAGMSFNEGGYLTACAYPVDGALCFSFDESTFNLEVIPNYAGTGRELVRLSTLPGHDISPLTQIRFFIPYDGTALTPGTHTNIANLFMGSTDEMACVTSTGRPTTTYTDDPLDLNGNGITTGDAHCNDPGAVTKNPVANFLNSQKRVKGDLDSDFQGFPTVGAVSEQGGAAEYELTLTNLGSNPLTNVVLYDILPHVGDTGVSDSQLNTSRGSDFPVELNGLLTGVPAGATVEYSDSTNPCRDEVAPSQNGTCTNDWVTSPDVIGDVRAFRVTIPTLPVGETVVITLPVDVVPDTTIYEPGEIAWNSFAVATDELLTTEPPKVGVSVPLSDISVEKTVNGGESASVAVGEEFIFEITVRHDTTVVENADGSVSYVDRDSGIETGAVSPARNVMLTDVVPAGMTLVSAVPAGAYDLATNTWTVGDIYPDQEFTLQLVATLDSLGSVTNAAHVTNNDTDDLDSTPNNWTGTPVEDDEDTAVVTAVMPALVLHKLVESSRDSDVYIEADGSDGRTGDYIIGQPIRYRFVVENLSALSLTDVVVSDPLIAGFCDPADLQVATLAGDALVTFDCEWPLGFADTAATIVNTASVTANYNVAELADSDTAAVEVRSPSGSIGDLVWDDLNADGVVDGDEAGIGGVTVNLLAVDGTVLATTTTLNVPADLDGDGAPEPVGAYLFEDVSAGTYIVQVIGGDGTPLEGLYQTYDEDDGATLSPVTAFTTSIVLVVDGVHSTADFGYVYIDPTSVTLVSFGAEWTEERVALAWETATEVDTVGFNLWRSTLADGAYTQINAALIPAASPGGTIGGSYMYFDGDVAGGKPYYYKLEELEISGARHWHGPILVEATAPTAVLLQTFDAAWQPQWLLLIAAIGVTVALLVGAVLTKRRRQVKVAEIRR